ncbi:MICOS complex subunit MIC27 [Hylaeus anthracinus]|uniref:MICOS complex subunit MIC27 n=1 Tax=Hylaeus anthracinus TaxID=313031 RepID=UPI0023B961A5|nr:MICOS complex subunit MIC27 [Hylaeus anthracinus]
MQRTMLFKKFLMPCGLCAAVPAMKPANPPEEHSKPCCNEAKPPSLIKPSELPIYSVDDGYSKEMPCVKYPSVVEENIRKARKSVQGLKVMYDNVSNNVSATVDSFKFVVDYLQDESNLLPRVGAVGIGGLSGLVLGLRGGFFKRLLYTSTGVGIVGSVCFPRETKEAINIVEHYGNIGYNFVIGVKPGDKPEISLKELPFMKTLFESDFYQMITRLFEQKTSNTTTEKVEEKPPANK